MKEELDNYTFNSNQEYEVLSQGLENQKNELLKAHQEELENIKKILMKIIGNKNQDRQRII